MMRRSRKRKIVDDEAGAPSSVPVTSIGSSSTTVSLAALASSAPSTEYKSPEVIYLDSGSDSKTRNVAMVLTEGGDQVTIVCEGVGNDKKSSLIIKSHDRLHKIPMDIDYVDIAVLPDNKHVITYNNEWAAKSNMLTLWDVKKAEKIRDVFLEPAHNHRRIALITPSVDGRNLFVLSFENTHYKLSVWDSANFMTPLHVYKDEDCYSMYRSINNELFVVNTFGFRKFKMENGQLKLIGESKSGNYEAATELSDGTLVVGSYDLTFWDHKKLDENGNGFIARYNPEPYTSRWPGFKFMIEVPYSNLFYACRILRRDNEYYIHVYLLDVSDCRRQVFRLLNRAEVKLMDHNVSKSAFSLTPEGYLLTPVGVLVKFDEVTQHYKAMNLQKLQHLKNVAGLPGGVAEMTLGFLTNIARDPNVSNHPSDNLSVNQVKKAN